MRRKQASRRQQSAYMTLACLLILGVSRAEAYVDPGTGGALFSMLGVMLGVLTTALAFGYSMIRRWGSMLWSKVVPHDDPSCSDGPDETDA